MTRIFTDEGTSIPVTVLEVLPNTITQIKSMSVDGYSAIQVTTGSCKRSRLSKPLAGHYAKANVEPGKGLWEFRVDNLDAAPELATGAQLNVDQFTDGQWVDVTSTSKGKGFAGTIKRHHFSAQDATHGNSRSHRVPGSIGQRQSPGKVFKGKKMCGQLGNVQRTVQSQQIVKIDSAKNLILVKGVVPGAPGVDVIISPAVKKMKNTEVNS